MLHLLCITLPIAFSGLSGAPVFARPGPHNLSWAKSRFFLSTRAQGINREKAYSTHGQNQFLTGSEGR